MTMKKILFDMDGTLYSFENWKYKWSKLEKEVQSNALKFLKVLEWNNYMQKFEEIKLQYVDEFSLAFEQFYNIKKETYFQTTWDIYPEKFIVNNRNAQAVFTYLKSIGYDIYIVSESPLIWIERVLHFLQVNNILAWIYSWQWVERKLNGRLYEKINNELGNGFYMIWDQIESDVIMAKKSGFKPIYISDNNQKSDEAMFNIQTLTDLYSIIL